MVDRPVDRGPTGETFSGEHNLTFIVFPFDLVVNPSGEDVGFGRMFTGSVGERVIEPRQVEGPPGLMMVQGLCRSKIREVPVVVQDLNRVLSSFQYMSPLFKSAYDRQ